MLYSTLREDLEASDRVQQPALESHCNAEQLGVWFCLLANVGATHAAATAVDVTGAGNGLQNNDSGLGDRRALGTRVSLRWDM